MRVTLFINKYTMKPSRGGDGNQLTIFGKDTWGEELPLVRLWGESATNFDDSITKIIPHGMDISDLNQAIQFDGTVALGKPIERDGKTVSIPYFKLLPSSLNILTGTDLLLAQKRAQAYRIQSLSEEMVEQGNTAGAIKLLQEYLSDFTGKHNVSTVEAAPQEEHQIEQELAQESSADIVERKEDKGQIKTDEVIVTGRSSSSQISSDEAQDIKNEQPFIQTTIKEPENNEKKVRRRSASMVEQSYEEGEDTSYDNSEASPELNQISHPVSVDPVSVEEKNRLEPSDEDSIASDKDSLEGSINLLEKNVGDDPVLSDQNNIPIEDKTKDSSLEANVTEISKLKPASRSPLPRKVTHPGAGFRFGNLAPRRMPVRTVVETSEQPEQGDMESSGPRM